MDIATLGRTIAPLAPIAGSILGGFLPIPGGSLIGQKLGEAIAGAFGLPPTATAGQVSDAIATAGEETARAKINAAMEVSRAQIQGFAEVEKAYTEALAQTALGTQETMRAEINSQESWFYRGWRPVAGWLYDVMMTLFGGILAWATVKDVLASTTPLQVLYEAWPLFAAYLGALAVVNGILIPSRSIEKKAAIENNAAMPNAKAAPLPELKPLKISAIFATAPAVRPSIIKPPLGDRSQ